MPVNKVAKGVGSSGVPMALSFPVCSVVSMRNPSPASPDPNNWSPSTGTVTPMINNPIPFSVSDTATAFIPPKIA